MRLHFLQHIAFEGPAAILDWAVETGHAITGSHLYRGDPLPDLSEFDMLILMGGPMSVNDEHIYPWLREEKRLVGKALAAGRVIFGVCLGAQIIASAMGAPVYSAEQKEIGWFPVRRVTEEKAGALLPEIFTPLHWHGETFDLPAGAVRLAGTCVTPNQAFQLGRAIGMQFHIEATPESVFSLIENAAHEIEDGEPFQQPPQSIIAQTPQASAAVRPILWKVMDFLASGGI